MNTKLIRVIFLFFLYFLTFHSLFYSAFSHINYLHVNLTHKIVLRASLIFCTVMKKKKVQYLKPLNMEIIITL